jgi:hypothetical protein
VDRVERDSDSWLVLAFRRVEIDWMVDSDSSRVDCIALRRKRRSLFWVKREEAISIAAERSDSRVVMVDSGTLLIPMYGCEEVGRWGVGSGWRVVMSLSGRGCWLEQ